MRGHGSTEPEISAGENAESFFVQDLCLWFRTGASAWLGTAAELLLELKARAGLEGEHWPENPQALCGDLERNTELLRTCGLDVQIKQQDNGPRLISIRPLDGTPGLSLQPEPDLVGVASAVEEKNDQKNTCGGEQTSNHEHQRGPSTDFSDPAEWHDARRSLRGFETANTVPTGFAHRIVITCIVILTVINLLVLLAWLWPASFPTTFLARNTERQPNPEVISGSRLDPDQATTAQGKTNQQSDTPKISHGEFVASDNRIAETSPIVPEGVPQLLDRSRLGDADAQYLLGRAYETGTGVEQDFVNAYSWYVIADASGNSKGKDAANQLTPKLGPSEIASVRSKVGSIYASGAYVPRDYTKAYLWFSLAAAAGDPQGEREKTQLAQKMTQQEIAEASNRASDWLKKHDRQVR